MNNKIHSSLINGCLTITEENEEELEQLRLDDENNQNEQIKQNHLLKINDGSLPTITLYDNDDRADILENDQQKPTMNQDYEERLSTIYESPSPPPRTEDDNEEEKQKQKKQEEDDDDDEEIYDDAYDKLIIYDVANTKSIEKVNR